MSSRSTPERTFWRRRVSVAALIVAAVTLSLRSGNDSPVTSQAPGAAHHRAWITTAARSTSQPQMMPEANLRTNLADAPKSAFVESLPEPWRETWTHLATERPVDALIWLGACPPSVHERLEAEVDQVFRRAMHQDVKATADAIAEFAPGGIGAALAARFALIEAEKNVLAAVRWAEALPSLAARDAALRAALDAWAQQDPQAAACYVATEVAAGRRERVIAGIAKLAAPAR